MIVRRAFNIIIILSLLFFSACSSSDRNGGGTSSGTSKTVALDIKTASAIVQTGDRLSLSSVEINDGVTISEYRWTFSDGQVVSGKDVTVSFPAAGIVAIKLEAFSGGASVASAEGQVAVVDPGVLAPAAYGLPETLGDVDGDKKLSLEDVLLAGQATSGIVTLAAEKLRSADINRDGNVNATDVALMQRAVLRGETLPRALLDSRGRPGAVVAMISPELLSTTATVNVRVDGQDTPQLLRTVRGYATFVVPDSVAKTATPAVVELLIDGAVKDRFSLSILDPVVLPSDAKADILGFLDTLTDAIGAQQTALREQIASSGLSDVDGAALLAAGDAGLAEIRATRAEFVTMFDGQNGTEIARIFQKALYANGLQETRSSGLSALATQRIAASGVPDPLCDVIVPALCKLKRATEILGTATNVVSSACTVAAGTLFVASLATAQLEVVPAVAKFFVSVCLRFEVALQFASATADFFEPIEPDLRITADKTTLAQGERAIVRTEITFLGTQELCATAVGAGASALAEKYITERLGNKIVGRLLNRSVAVAALARIFALLGEDAYAGLLRHIRDSVSTTLDNSGIPDAIGRLASNLCPKIGFGAAQAVAANILQTPKIDEGNLFFKSDGTAEYFCPPPGPVFKSKIDLIGTKQLCSSPPATAKVTMTCATSPVTITMGDNGSALDDIFEVVIGGRTVLTSNGPTRSISTTIQLPKGRTEVIMRGLAAPDGIGTYFISFSGAAVVSGDALSGTDLIPGTSKRFIIEVL